MFKYHIYIVDEVNLIRHVSLNSPYNILTVALPTVYFSYHGYTDFVAMAVTVNK